MKFNLLFRKPSRRVGGGEGLTPFSPQPLPTLHRGPMSASDVQDSFLVSLLEAALEAEVGIRIPSNSGSSLKSLLYRIRRQEPRYQVLRLTTSPDNPDEIWIVHKRHYTPTQGPYARETQINFEDLFSEE